jgi:ABC-2 type transport system permease protein
MSKTGKIVQWEVMRNLHNKQFIIGLFLTPLLIALFAGVPRILERLDKPETVRYYVIDDIDALETLQKGISSETIILRSYEGNREDIEDQTKSDKFTGYFFLQEDFWQSGNLPMFFKERNHQAERTIKAVLGGLLQQNRMQQLGVDEEQVSYLTAAAKLEMIPMEEAIVPQANEIMVSIAFIVLIFFLIFSSGSMLMQSASQERRDRMAEIILSSVTSSQLMQGKIIGQFLLGMIQLLFWITISLPLVIYILEFPVMQAIMDTNLMVVVMFGLLGYLLFSSLFVSMGATMEDMQSAGNSQGLVIMIPMLSFLFISPVVNNPNGMVSRFAGLFPITSPVIMILRNAVTKVPVWEIIASGVILALSSYFTIKAAGKIFRIGMLMYGKTATISEIFRWLKYPD